MNKLALNALMLLIVASRANAAYDSEDNFKAYVQLGVKSDSNLYRLDAGEQNATTQAEGRRSDVIFSSEVGANYSKSVSKQLFEIKTKYFSPHYSAFDQLNYSGWSASGSWKWAVGQHFSGDLSYSNGKTLSSFEDISGVTAGSSSVSADMVENRALSGSVNYLMGQNVQFGAAFSRRDGDHSLTKSLDLKQNNHTFSVTYITNKNNSIQIYSSKTDYDYKRALNPFFSAADRGLSVQQEGVSLMWVISPKTQFSAGWGQAKTNFVMGSASPKTSIGNLGLVLAPTAKLKFKASFGQTVDAGVNGLGSNVLKSYSLRSDYNYSPKTNFYLSGLYSKRDYGSSAQTDQDANLEIGLSYLPLRNVDISAVSTVMKRGVQNVSYPAGYEAFVIGITTRVWF